MSQDGNIIRALYLKSQGPYTQGVKEAGVEAGIARCKAKLRAYHRIASGSGVNSAYVAVNLKSEFDLGQPPKQRTRKKILTLHHLLHQNLVRTWLY